MFRLGQRDRPTHGELDEKLGSYWSLFPSLRSIFGVKIPWMGHRFFNIIKFGNSRLVSIFPPQGLGARVGICLLSNSPYIPAASSLGGNTLTLNAPIATKVVCFSRLLKCLRSLYGKQCGSPIGAVCFWSTLFASILNSSLKLGNYLQQTTSADDIFRCIFFLGALRVNRSVCLDITLNTNEVPVPRGPRDFGQVSIKKCADQEIFVKGWGVQA